jgi:hypothetical protein
MTRSKSKPPVKKPLFDGESALRFAEEAPQHPAGAPEPGVLTLRLGSAVIARLEQEAVRKGRTVELLVEKLIAKHLAKH